MNIDSLIPRVRTYARSIPDPTAVRAIIKATQDLCVRTQVWKQNHTVTVTSPLAQSVTVAAGARIIGINTAFLGDIRLLPANENQMDAINDRWSFDDEIDAAAPRYIISPEPGIIRIWPPCTGDLKARYTLEPTETADIIPDLMAEHSETIALGASAIAMMMPGTDFYNPQLAAANDARFRSAIDTLMMRAYRSTVRAQPRTTSRYF